MSRLGKLCPGDCSRCEMLANGEVQMVPCILDQIFQGQRRIEKELAAHKTALGTITDEVRIIESSLSGLTSQVEALASTDVGTPALVGGTDV